MRQSPKRSKVKPDTRPDIQLLQEGIRRFEEDLVADSVTHERIAAHVNLMLWGVQVLKKVVGSNAADIVRITNSTLYRNQFRHQMFLWGNPPDQLNASTDYVGEMRRTDFDKNYRSYIHDEAAMMLRAFKRIYRKFAPALTKDSSAVEDAEVMLQTSSVVSHK